MHQSYNSVRKDYFFCPKCPYNGHFRYGAEHPLSEFLSLMFFNAQLRGKTCQNDQKTG